MKNTLSLYVHIPFCVSKCDYCDFYSEEVIHGLHIMLRKQPPYSRIFIREFLDSLILDIYEQVERFKVERIPTAYIGGGTPSVLGADIKILLDALKRLPSFKPEEFTIEANPESCTEEFLVICKESGVTRLSLGVQTFHEPSRKAVNRAGDIPAIEKALSLASLYYPNDLSVDLITGFPFHTKEIVLQDIKKILNYNPAHVSVYSLALEPETPLYKKVKDEVVSLPENDVSDELWLTAREALINAGYKHYEVSNFARKNKECKHNLRYWRMQGWLGAGPSASGTIIDQETKTALRYTYKESVNELYTPSNSTRQGVDKITLNGESTSNSNPDEKCEGAPATDSARSRIEISKDELIREIIMMGYRYCEGPDTKWGVGKLIHNTLAKWNNKNKMLYLNSFLVDAFNELENP